MSYIDPKYPYNHLRNLDDWIPTIRATTRWKFRHLKEDDFEDLCSNIVLKLATYNFPNCIKGFASGNNTPRSPYNYLFTCVIRAYFDYNKKQQRIFTYQVENLEEVMKEFYFEDFDLTLLQFDNLTASEQQLFLDAMDNKKNLHKLYAPWEIKMFCESMGIEEPIEDNKLEDSVD
jgi:DNA-directed RNA polymerase specialized sigma24 family protein